MSWYDEILAKNVQDQLNCTGITENAVIPREKENYRPKTLIDQTLEYIDPTPNIHTLFIQFNKKFFWDKLLPVQVKWSERMTTCAGTCSFHPRNKECIIALSSPLLKLRPRKDLIETLLHEMIHAYLFLTNNNKDRDGHGPVFQSHMKRINREAGTNITIYHDFHDEVRLYQQHWWRCNGSCQKRAPYFGMVRRAMNRAPGPNDFWWNEHKSTCGGQFIKIKEPEKPISNKAKKGRASTGSAVIKPPNNSSILDWMKKNDNNKNVKVPVLATSSQTSLSNKNKIVNPGVTVSSNLTKLGNATNNVYGWGVGGPNSSSNSSSNSTNKINNPVKSGNARMSFSGVLGGSGTGKSSLLDKFSNTTSSVITNKVPAKKKHITENDMNLPSTSKNLNTDDYLPNTLLIECPNCSKSVDETKINQHLDICLLQDSVDLKIIPSTSAKKRKNENEDYIPNKMSKSDFGYNEIKCPLCNKKITVDKFNDHLDLCLQNDFENETSNNVINLDDSGSSSVNLHDSPHVCLICNKPLKAGETLNNHLEECVASVFNDSDANISESEMKETSKSEILDKYPCPVCMELIKQSLMNEHLDTCINE